MTTVVAMVEPDRGVLMVADTTVSYGETLVPGSARKIVRARVMSKPGKADRKAGRRSEQVGEFLIAGSGAAAMAGVLTHLHVRGLPDPDDDAECDRWAQAVAEAATGLVKDMVPEQTDHGGGWAGSHLIGYAGRIWWTGHNAASRWPDSYGAIGSGSDFALAALDVCHVLAVERSADLIVNTALQVATMRDPWTGPPFQVERLAYPA